MRPVRIPQKIQTLLHPSLPPVPRCAEISRLYIALRKQGEPSVSVVIPAYNEEKGILATLHSLVQNRTRFAVEIIVVDNNSSDQTAAVVKAAGIPCVAEKKQGITAARNAGLHAARGAFVLNADADAIYPEAWIDEMVTPLASDDKISLTYGRFSFVPTAGTGRFAYFFYEYAADAQRYFKKFFREEAVNVYGFNSAFRREQGVSVEGFNHPKGANEDGYLALKLRNAGYGRLHYVTAIKALVWTADRRIQMDGGFVKGLTLRVRKFFLPKSFVQVRTDL